MSDSATSTNLQLSSPVYDKLKQVVQILLPGVGSLYLALATLWNLPYADQVVGTCAALALFLGLVLQVSTRSYNSDMNSIGGSLNVTSVEDGSKRYSFLVDTDPEILETKSEIRFKVNQH